MLENPEVKKWLEVLSVDPEPDEDLINYLENILTEAVHSKRMAEPFPEEPDVDGKYRFGRTTYGCPVGFNKDEILRHTLIVGDTGSGKTTYLKNIF